MTQDWIKIDLLKPKQYCFRKVNATRLKGLKASIEKYGQQRPIHINIHRSRDHVIIEGEQIYKICLELDFEMIHVVVHNCDLKTEKELNIRLNTEASDLDREMFLAEFGWNDIEDYGFEVRDFEGFDLNPGGTHDPSKGQREPYKPQKRIVDLRFGFFRDERNLINDRINAIQKELNHKSTSETLKFILEYYEKNNCTINQEGPEVA